MKIILAEDNPGDSRLLREAFHRLYPEDEIIAVEDGSLVVETLKKEPQTEVVILDLNLPKKDGLEILAEIRRDKKMKSLSIAVLTTSQWQADHQACKLLEADACFVKPSRFAEILKLVQNIRDLASKKSARP